jgi:hypothetical protein
LSQAAPAFCGALQRLQQDERERLADGKRCSQTWLGNHGLPASLVGGVPGRKQSPKQEVDHQESDEENDETLKAASVSGFR